MKVSYELKQGYIDIWNEESEEWDRYIKVNKKSVVEEENKKCTVETCCIGIEGLSKALLKIKDDMKSVYENIDKVETLEEDKKIPEKLDIRQEKNIKNNWKWKVYGKEHSYNISTPQKIIADKINEIIDYLQYLKSKGE